MKLITTVTLAAATLAGCSTYRWDVADCADIGMWDPAPRRCWCEPGDLSCQRLADAQSLYESARRYYHAHPHLDGGVVMPGSTHPTAALSAWADARDWRQAEALAAPDWKSGDRGAGRMAADAWQADSPACAWICFSGHRGQRPEGCDCE